MKKYEISHSTSVGEADLYLIWDVTGKERELYCFYTEEYKDEIKGCNSPLRRK